MSTHTPKWALALLMPTLLVGCAGSGMDDLERYAAEVKARPPGRIEPLPEIKQVETFIYIPGDRRNPFKPEEEEPIGPGPISDPNGPAPDPFRRKEELEAFPLDTIRMVGTMEQGGDNWGLVMNSGIIYRVKVGNYMGQNHGQIMRIDEDRIELTEIVSDGRDGYKERRAQMGLETQE